MSQVARGLADLGVDLHGALEFIEPKPSEGTGLPLTERIPLSAIPLLWTQMNGAAEKSGVGLRLAERIRPEMWEVFGYVVKCSATLGDACVRAGRFIELLCDGIELGLHVEGSRAVLSYRGLAPELAHSEITEFILGAITTCARQISGRFDLQPAEVRFTHGPPPNIEAHTTMFGCPVFFRRPQNALLFPSEALHLSVLEYDPKLCALLDRQASQLLEALPRPSTLTRRVQEIISRELQGGSPTVDRVSAELGMHSRTLGRRLRAEGTSFQQLLDELRHELADRYLSEPGLSIGEVAFLLGYSDPSAFNKAFRRWTGTAPHEYRRHVSSHPPPLAANEN
jgi:AraC-like DNA-binding protein